MTSQPTLIGTIKVANHIRTAWRDGNKIVPLIGAGLSADSGVPTLSDVTVYLTLLSYLSHDITNLFSNRISVGARERIIACARTLGLDILAPHVTINHFVKQFDWPDRYDLYFELTASKPATTSLSSLYYDRLEAIAKAMRPASWRILTDNYQQNDQRPLPPFFNPSFAVLSDWREFIRHLTGHDHTLADSLFGSIYSRRVPTSQHVLFVALVRLLGTQVILTQNFDNLLESALNAEDMPCRVFDMPQGDTLPPALLVKDGLSLIKMHGGLMDLLLDQRLDDPLSPDYLNCLGSIVGDAPMLLVIGCSGNERRLCDIVSHVIADREGNVVWFNHAFSKLPDAICTLSAKHPAQFLHLGFRNLSLTLATIFSLITERLPSSRSVYSYLYSIPYIHPPSVPDNHQSPWLEKHATHLGTHGFAIIAHHRTEKGPDAVDRFEKDASVSRQYYPSATMTLVSSLSTIALNYKIVWLDLELHYSLGDLISGIAEQLRAKDTDLPPFLLAEHRGADDGAADVAALKADARRAAARVVRALSRDNYLLAIDGIEAYPWRPTAHHGFATNESPDAVAAQTDALVEFLRTLCHAITDNKTDARLVLAVDEPRPRHPDSVRQRAILARSHIASAIATNLAFHAGYEPGSLSPADGLLRSFVGSAYGPPRQVAKPSPTSVLWSNFKIDKGYAVDSSAVPMEILLHAVSSIRRIRCRHTLFEVFCALRGDESDRSKKANQAIDAIHRVSFADDGPRLLHRLDGEGVLMDRQVRDMIYGHNTRLASANRLAKLTPTGVQHTVDQLLIAAHIHDLIGKVYYRDIFFPSKDANAFHEYIYHRVSSLRYAAVCHWVLESRRSSGLSSLRLGRLQYALLFVDGPNKAAVQTFSVASFDELIESLKTFRELGIQGIKQAWRKAECDLRVTLSADRLINLGRAVIADKERLCLPTDEKAKQALRDRLGNSPKWVKRVSATESRIATSANEMVEEVRKTVARCFYGIGDFRSFLCDATLPGALLRLALPDRHLPLGQKLRALCGSNNVDVAKQLADILAQLDTPVDDDRIHAYLDAMIGLHWLLMSTRRHTQASIALLISALTTLEDSFKKGEQDGGERNRPSADPEARARVSYMIVEIALGHWLLAGAVQVFGRRPYLGPLNGKADSAGLLHFRDLSDPTKAFKLLRERLQDAIRYVREDADTHGDVNSPLLNPVSDRSLYAPYHALYSLLYARLKILESAWTADRALSSLDDPHLREAYKRADTARSCVDDRNPMLRALSDLICAQIALAQVKGLSADHGSAAVVNMKMRTASQYLRRCRSVLRRSETQVLIWREFYHSAARYHFERVVLEYRKLVVELRSASVGAGGGRDMLDCLDDARCLLGEAAPQTYARVLRMLEVIGAGMDYCNNMSIGIVIEFGGLWIEGLCVAFWSALAACLLAMRATKGLGDEGFDRTKVTVLSILTDVVDSYIMLSGHYGLLVDGDVRSGLVTLIYQTLKIDAVLVCDMRGDALPGVVEVRKMSRAIVEGCNGSPLRCDEEVI